MSIEGIVLEKFIVTAHPEIVSAPKSCTHHSVFHYFLSDGIEQDDATTDAQSRQAIKFLKQRNIMFEKLSTIWENSDGYTEHY